MDINHVATHSGAFQCDDVLCLSILKKVIGGKFKLTRSRVPKEYEEADLIFDIGAEYEPDALKFDHHQKGGAGARENSIPYSSAGLLWKHFGRKLVDTDEQWEYVDRQLMQPVDAYDCGYKITSDDPILQEMNLSRMVEELFAPTWQEDSSLKALDAGFIEATKLTDFVLDKVISKAKAVSAAKDILNKSIKERVYKEILILDQLLPWKQVIHESEEAQDVLYVVYPASNGDWMCQCVPVEFGSFDSKLSLPESWGGLRFEELDEESGIKDTVFCHRGLFTCGGRTRDIAVALAQKSLQIQKNLA